ncbi:MAG: sigma-70 family RNA polymerase sigma factor [Planctomycetota bacterium]
MHPRDDVDEALLARLRAGDDSAFGPLFEAQRDRLRRMIQFRLDPRLVGRVDPEDVVQEVFLDAQKRLYAFREDAQSLPFWLRLVAQQTLIDLHRRHLGALKRNAARERVFAHSHGLSGFLAGSLTSPSQAAMRDELRQQLHAALEAMDEIDREVLTLRHFEDLGNKEVAELLGIGENAASNRYVRALGRLKGLLGGFSQP